MTEDGYSETSSHLPDNVRDTGSLCHITVTDIHQRQGQQRGEEQSHTQSAQIKTQHDVPLLGQKRQIIVHIETQSHQQDSRHDKDLGVDPLHQFAGQRRSHSLDNPHWHEKHTGLQSRIAQIIL